MGETDTAMVELPEERSGIHKKARYAVEVIDGSLRGRILPIDAGVVCKVGKAAQMDLVLDDPTVSRHHCDIELVDGAPRVTDRGSTNGTIVDGVPVTDAWLRDLSSIRIGQTTLRVCAHGGHEKRISDAASFGNLVGRSLAMRRAFYELEIAAGTDYTVLVNGETGTGKEEAARAIHDRSSRAGKPFVVIDCSAVPNNLLESELFGHERGAFTDAVKARIGAFEAAEGGTVFIDEVGELPIDLQPRLLRVLERFTIRRVGCMEERPVDVRVVAATHRDLRTAVDEGRFREDLFYRLAVLEVELPSLRERPEDVPILVDTLLERRDWDTPEARAVLTPEILAAMSRCAWPGNVRQLRNYVDRAVALGVAPELTADEADLGVDPRIPYEEARKRALSQFEKAYVTALLDHHGGRASDAAKACGMSRAYFYRLIGRHGLKDVG